MEPNLCPAPMLIGELSLDNWEVIGSGGFGQIFKARHVHWVWDVAIKILHYDNGTSSALLREAELMRRGESPYVVRVSGVFKGRLPSSGHSVHLGLVMDYMEQGSLADLQGTLCGPPPWPLAFRLPYQVALGMNFLHTLSPPLLHLDLKPSNVLLDSSLNVKLTDFGLSRTYYSESRKSRVGSDDEGGTTSYMPPEAFLMNYKPTCSTDMYSYGILLWSILTGQKPYTNAFSSLVRLRIPEGDRPALEEIDLGQAEGLGPLVDLMCRCWDSVPQQRPSFLDCISVTEKQYSIHKSGINNTVHHVSDLLEKEREAKKISEGFTKLQITRQSASMSTPMDLTGPPPVQEKEREAKKISEGFTKPQITRPSRCPAASMSVLMDLTGPPPVQETAGGQTMKNRVPDKGTDESSSQPMSFSEIPLTYTEEMSSETPNHAPGSESQTTHSSGEEDPPRANFRPMGPGSYQRQCSNPEAFQHQPIPVSIKDSSVTWFQNGRGNYMHISTSEVAAERRRHPTAPPRFNTTPPHNPGSGQTGKLG